MDASSISLTDVFRKDSTGTRFLVAKNVPLNIDVELCELYFEAIVKGEVVDIGKLEDEPGVLVVEFVEAIKDIDAVKRKALARPLNGVVLGLECIGTPTGLYISGMRSNVSKDMLQLKFENKRSGGLDECVEEVHFVQTGPTKNANIRISNGRALTSILSIDGHQLENAELQLQPYYPPIHDAIWTRLKLEKPVQVANDAGTSAKQNHSKKGTPNVPLSNVNQQMRPVAPRRKPPMPRARSTSDEQGAGTNNEQVSKLRVYCENTDERSEPLLTNYQYNNERHNQFEQTKPTFEEPESTGDGSRNREKKPRRNNRWRSNSHGRPRDSQTPLTLPEKTKTTEPQLEEEMDLSPTKITLLIIYRFQTKNENQGFKVVFQERNGKVIIKGHTDEDMRNARLKIHECLNRVDSMSEPLSESRYNFLSRVESKNCIRERSKAKKCWASFEIRDSPPELFCHAFNQEKCENAMKFISNEITVFTIELRPGQQNQLLENAWKSLIAELDTGLTTVYVDNGESDVAKIVIESFLGRKASEARGRIIGFLKNNVPREKEEITLEGARARCFNDNLNAQLTRTIKVQHGKLWVNTMCKEPLKLSVSVEGDQRVVSALRNVEQQICTEQVDFITLWQDMQREELWLLYTGLNSPFGKDFLRQFERLNNCFLDIEQDGTFALPTKRRSVVSARKASPVAEFDPLVEKMCEPVEPRPRRGNGFSPRGRSTSGFALRKSPCIEVDRISPVYDHTNEQYMADISLDKMRMKNPFQQQQLRQQYMQKQVTAMPSGSGSVVRLGPQQSQTLNIGGITVNLKQGQIVDETADALVNIVSPNHAMGESVLSKEFIKKAGSGLLQVHQQEVIRMASNDETCYVISTDSMNMANCSTVLHVALKKGQTYCDKMIPVVMREILEHCRSRGCNSVAIPPLGVGRMYKYPPDTVARLMLSAITTDSSGLMRRRMFLQSITIVTYDTETHNVFDSVFQSFDPAQKSSALAQLRAFSDNFHFGQVPAATRKMPPAVRVDSITPPRSSSANIRRPEPQAKPRVAHKPLPRTSRFPDDKPVARTKVTITAVGRDCCIAARNDLGQKVKDEFLYKEVLEKKSTISTEAKQKIVDKLVSYDVKSFAVGDTYVLKGQKDKVNNAYKEILQILLEDRQATKTGRKYLANVRPGTTKFVSMMIDLEPSVPEYWQLFKTDITIRTLLKEGGIEKIKKVPLRSSSPQYQAIDRMFQSNIEPSKVGQGQDAIGIRYNSLNIVQIQRIENVSLYESFVRKRIELYQKLHTAGMVRFPEVANLPGCTGPVATESNLSSVLNDDMHRSLNEVLLFHGTKPELVDVICNGGFDERRGSGRAMFGQGIYGAEKSMKADQYTDSKTSRISGPGQRKQMFLMRMVLGNSYLCTNSNPPKYCRPPCTSCYDDKCNNHGHAGPLGHIFDSVTGDNGKLFREFVVYDRSLCYPEYLITYERI